AGTWIGRSRPGPSAPTGRCNDVPSDVTPVDQEVTMDKALDPARTRAFAGRMLSLLNDALLSILVSIGHRTGLFDRLAALPPSPSAEIAAAAGLDERYVREWLGAMVTGRVVEFDGARGTYWLAPEHAAALTRSAGPGNMAMVTQLVSE